MTDTTPAPPSTRPDDPSSAQRTALRMLPWAIPWAITIVAVLAAVWSTSQWLQLRDLEVQAEAQAEIVAVTSAFTNALVNWDAEDGLDETLEQLRGYGAGDFLTEADELFGGGDLRDQLEALGARSEGEIEDLFVQRIEGDRAIAFVVAQQVITTDATDATDTSFRSARVALEHLDGRWRVVSVELVSPELTEVQAPEEDQE